MSRALEKELLASLRQSDPNEAYQAIASALTVKGDTLLEIEILGRSHPLPPGVHLLKDENAVGVSNLSLVQAFLVARQMLMKYQAGHASAQVDDLSAATAVILLMDPEYLTAANTRKRLLQQQFELGAPLLDLVQREKCFTDSFLTSPLHRHSKSPTLWSHRRWLLQTARASCMSLIDVPADFVNVVFVSAQRHPRNYYSWCHARLLMDIMSDSSYRSQHDFEAEEKRILELAKQWCTAHHTDISGWTFLFFLLVVRDSTLREHCSDIFTDVIQLATSLRWSNETVWVFLRSLISSGQMSRNEYDVFNDKLEALKSSIGSNPEDLSVLDKARTWAETYRVTS